VIAGRIVDEFGEPLTGAQVSVLRYGYVNGVRQLRPAGQGNRTDDQGAFRVFGLPPGEYYVAASTGLIDAVKRDPPVYYPGTMSFAEAQPITLGAGADASADFQIVDGSTWNGSPRDNRGRPGACEQALVGTPVVDPNRPLELLRTIHSFALCSACAVH